jgi:hypothetical protein
MITKQQALAKLAANPQAASEFDAATKRDNPGLTRDQAVELTLRVLNTKQDRAATLAKLKRESEALKTNLAALKKVVAKAQTAQSSTKLAGASYSILHQAATHRSASEQDRVAARAALIASHGVTITDSGIVSHSQRGGRAAKLSKSNQ